MSITAKFTVSPADYHAYSRMRFRMANAISAEMKAALAGATTETSVVGLAVNAIGGVVADLAASAAQTPADQRGVLDDFLACIRVSAELDLTLPVTPSINKEPPA